MMNGIKTRMAALKAALATRLVDNWKNLHRFYSVWAASIGGGLLTAWQIIPDDMRAYLPHFIPIVAAYVTLICVVIGAATKQDFRGKPPTDGGKNV